MSLCVCCIQCSGGRVCMNEREHKHLRESISVCTSMRLWWDSYTRARHVRVKWVCAFNPNLRVCLSAICVATWAGKMYFSGVYTVCRAHAQVCNQTPLSLAVKPLFRKSLGVWSHYVLFHLTILGLIRITSLASPEPPSERRTHCMSLSWQNLHSFRIYCLTHECGKRFSVAPSQTASKLLQSATHFSTDAQLNRPTIHILIPHQHKILIKHWVNHARFPCIAFLIMILGWWKTKGGSEKKAVQLFKPDTKNSY